MLYAHADARPGWYINTDGATRIGTKCTIGTYTTAYNQVHLQGATSIFSLTLLQTNYTVGRDG